MVLVKSEKSFSESVDFILKCLYNNKSRQDKSKQNELFRSSSVVEQPAVNRLVVGSSPTFGAMARWSSG